MHTVDMNLLAALDALLAEGSVTGAARRLGLSASAKDKYTQLISLSWQ